MDSIYYAYKAFKIAKSTYGRHADKQEYAAVQEELLKQLAEKKELIKHTYKDFLFDFGYFHQIEVPAGFEKSAMTTFVDLDLKCVDYSDEKFMLAYAFGMLPSGGKLGKWTRSILAKTTKKMPNLSSKLMLKYYFIFYDSPTYDIGCDELDECIEGGLADPRARIFVPLQVESKNGMIFSKVQVIKEGNEQIWVYAVMPADAPMTEEFGDRVLFYMNQLEEEKKEGKNVEIWKAPRVGDKLTSVDSKLDTGAVDDAPAEVAAVPAQ